jgi:hypothetical protein
LPGRFSERLLTQNVRQGKASPAGRQNGLQKASPWYRGGTVHGQPSISVRVLQVQTHHFAPDANPAIFRNCRRDPSQVVACRSPRIESISEFSKGTLVPSTGSASEYNPILLGKKTRISRVMCV